jgi:uncharacterized membrane protein YfcA
MDLLVVAAIGTALGLTLGMLGGGGGVLAVPLLVAIGEPVLVASTMSLVIVGTAAAAALVPHARAGRVDWPVGLMFGALGSLGAVVGAGAAQHASPTVLLAGLAILLAGGAVTMIRAAVSERRWQRGSGLVAEHSEARSAPAAGSLTYPMPCLSRRSQALIGARTAVLAGGVGLITGFFGVGAGFVVIPALVTALRMPVKRASATALVVIAINSFAALAVRHDHLGPAGLMTVLMMSAAFFAVLGARVSRYVPGWALSSAFGVLMAVLATFTLGNALAPA